MFSFLLFSLSRLWRLKSGYDSVRREKGREMSDGDLITGALRCESCCWLSFEKLFHLSLLPMVTIATAFFYFIFFFFYIITFEIKIQIYRSENFKKILQYKFSKYFMTYDYFLIQIKNYKKSIYNWESKFAIFGSWRVSVTLPKGEKYDRKSL